MSEPIEKNNDFRLGRDAMGRKGYIVNQPLNVVELQPSGFSPLYSILKLEFKKTSIEISLRYRGGFS